MNQEVDDFYWFINNSEVLWNNYSGFIDMDEGLSRINQLDLLFQKLSGLEKPLKILMDTRGYIKSEAHDELAKIGRSKLEKEYNCIFAVLHDENEFEVSEKEQWFVNEQKALDWLSENC